MRKHPQIPISNQLKNTQTETIIMETLFFSGTPMHLYGKLIEAGEAAPNFALVGKDLSEISLHDYKGKRVVLNVFPSLDTDVCAARVRRFNQDAASYDNTVVLCVSMDLPFAAAKFCSVNGIDNVKTASAFRSDFGKSYGLEIADCPLRGLLARAVVVVNEEGMVVGVSLCREITEEPDYEFVKTLLAKEK